jgi:hypothetical protein
MKSLNQQEIQQAFNRFLAWFAGLLLATVTCVYSYVHTSSHQLGELSRQKETFDEVFLMDATLADRVDSLYVYMGLLNTGRLQDDQQMQRLITRKKEALTKQVNQQQKSQQYFAVYNRLFSHVNEMLLQKDSLNKTTMEEQDLREQLTDCLRRAAEDNRQRR